MISLFWTTSFFSATYKIILKFVIVKTIPAIAKE